MGPRFKHGYKETRLSVKDWLFLSMVRIIDKKGKVLARKFCFSYDAHEMSIVAGKWLMFADGKCFKIVEKCGDTGLYIVLEHVPEIDVSGQLKQVNMFFCVYDVKVTGEPQLRIKMLHKINGCSTGVDTLTAKMSFKGDYIEYANVESKFGENRLVYGALSLDGSVLLQQDT